MKHQTKVKNSTMATDNHKTPNERFSKYDFVKAFIANATTEKQKKEKEAEAVLIADAIQKQEKISFEHLATKEQVEELGLAVRKDITNLETSLRKEMNSLETSLRKEIKISMLTTIVSMGTIVALAEKFLN